MDQLIKLQAIDTKLKDLNDLLGDLPSKVEELDQREQTVKNNIDEKENRLKELELAIRKKDNQMTLSSQKISRLKDQLFKVTNNKQYDAIMVEIDHVKNQRSNQETESLEMMEEKDELIQNSSKLKNDLVGLSKDLTLRKEKLKVAIEDSAEQRSSLEKERKKKQDAIDEETLKIYKKVIKARKGIAVVPLAGSGCGGCGAHIPPQTVTEVRAGSGLHRCDMCGRFLYYEKIIIN